MQAAGDARAKLARNAPGGMAALSRSCAQRISLRGPRARITDHRWVKAEVLAAQDARGDPVRDTG